MFDQPIRAGNRYITILARRNELGYPRLGVIVSRRSAKLAVQRNRFKRLVREDFRQRQHSLANCDYIVLAKSGIATQTNQQVNELLAQNWRRLQRQQES